MPLLAEKTRFGGTYNDKEWRVCDLAADTLARLLGWPVRLRKYSEMQDRATLIAKLRRWAEPATRPTP